MCAALAFSQTNSKNHTVCYSPGTGSFLEEETRRPVDVTDALKRDEFTFLPSFSMISPPERQKGQNLWFVGITASRDGSLLINVFLISKKHSIVLEICCGIG